jgi:predicted site-specific integrase-resolvase
MSANLASDPTALTRTLTMLSQPETAVVRQGEKILKPFLKLTSCILPLINQIRSNPDESVRHHAALILKRRIAVLYGKFSASQKQDLKLQVLSLMVSEPLKSIGIALAGVVASVAKRVLSTENQWPELFGMLLQLSRDPKENMRSLNYSLLEQVIDSY